MTIDQRAPSRPSERATNAGLPAQRRRRWAGLAAHLFTALGAGLGFWALTAAADRRFDVCFAALGIALVVDGLDGALARRLRVRETAPFIDGALLDLVVDYQTYVVAPLFAVWRSQTQASAAFIVVCAIAAAIASALYFADARMKTADHWFRGFPACWNIFALYYFTFRPPLWLTAAGLLAAAALMFAPIAAVHPLRVVRLRPLTTAVSVLWLACAAVLVWRGFRSSPIAQWGLALTGIYFIALSVLRASRPDARSA